MFSYFEKKIDQGIHNTALKHGAWIMILADGQLQGLIPVSSMAST